MVPSPFWRPRDYTMFMSPMVINPPSAQHVGVKHDHFGRVAVDGTWPSTGMPRKNSTYVIANHRSGAGPYKRDMAMSNPKAIATMKEDGIDISQHTSNNVLEYQDVDFDYVITVCDNAKERCPYFPSKAQKFHHNFPDPAKATGTEEEVRAEFARVREMIKEYCSRFISDIVLNGDQDNH